jgi:Protein of unknown function (DUF2922)
MVRDLVMTFSDIKGAKFNLRLRNVKADITEAEIGQVMDAVVTSRLFSSKNGELQGKEYAALVETNKTQYSEV